MEGCRCSHVDSSGQVDRQGKSDTRSSTLIVCFFSLCMERSNIWRVIGADVVTLQNNTSAIRKLKAGIRKPRKVDRNLLKTDLELFEIEFLPIVFWTERNSILNQADYAQLLPAALREREALHCPPVHIALSGFQQNSNCQEKFAVLLLREL